MPGLTCCHNDLRKFQVRGKLYTLHELKGPFKKLAKDGPQGCCSQAGL